MVIERRQSIGERKMAEYIEVSEVEAIATSIIPKLLWPEQPKIKYLVLSAEKSNYLGKCSKASGKWKYLTDYDYVIEVWESFWDTADMFAQEALLYHELLHIMPVDKDGEIKWKMRKHDVEEFLEVASKYKAWNAGLQRLVEILK
jgi:hypothetical protein